jgi:acyl dehydratase
MSTPERVAAKVGGPWFEDFERGQSFYAPALTLTEGHAALHQAICGDRLRLALDAPLCAGVTGGDAPLAHPNLVCDVSIGQSTGPTQRVLGNLFYRGLVLERQIYIGDTLRTHTEVVALKENRRKPAARATGLVLLRIRTADQEERPVLDYWRCPMLPLREGAAETGHADDFSIVSEALDPVRVERATPTGWQLDPLRAVAARPHFADLSPGLEFSVAAGETVTAAPELARLTLNLAMAHTDATSGTSARRLVYGGHTISVAAAHATRAIDAIATIVAWERADHLGPVFEGDVLRTELSVERTTPLDEGGGLAGLRAVVSAVRGESDAPEPVLDWGFVAVVA